MNTVQQIGTMSLLYYMQNTTIICTTTNNNNLFVLFLFCSFLIFTRATRQTVCITEVPILFLNFIFFYFIISLMFRFSIS